MLSSASFAVLLGGGDSALLTPGVLGLALAVALLGYALLPSAQERALRHIPQPATTLPILANTIDFAQSASRLYDFFLDETQRQHGKMWRYRAIGLPVTLVLTTPEAYEDVLKTKFDDFAKGYVMWKNMEDLLGNGIFTVDGKLWVHQRKTASHLFSLQMMRDSMEQTAIHYTAILQSRLENIAHNNEVVNLKRLLDLFTMDVFTKIGFGVDLNNLKSNENHEFLNAFERVSSTLFARFTAPMWVWQVKKWLNIGSEKSMAKDIKALNTLIFDIISRSMAKQTAARVNDVANAASGGSRDLISLFFEKESTEYANGEQVKTDQAKLIRDMTLSFVAAGRDTTSQSMSWFLLMLNQYPDVLAKIREELKDKLPDLVNGKKLVPSMEDVQQLVYLDAALKESLRLNPVVAVNSRIAVRDTTLSDGTLIKKGTKVSMPHYATARLEAFWGKDAAEYNPDRWLDPATRKPILVSPYRYTTFSGGPRVCIGMKFAMMEMKIAMATVLSHFDVKTVRDPFAIMYRPTLTMTIDGPVDVRVMKRTVSVS
uniref:Cytochrome P450 n=1 Tax=Globisporangium ultimum (strain ATCC 200006 / CBS 805.95 / DAOM BR144) TaxID=431595 RepID=K3W7E8_GLOUD